MSPFQHRTLLKAHVKEALGDDWKILILPTSTPDHFDVRGKGRRSSYGVFVGLDNALYHAKQHRHPTPVKH